jgi:branched-chain amino acid transport system permease protein
VALVAAPFLLSEYALSQFSFIGIYAIVCLGLMLLSGFTGQVSLGHAGFLAMGAYTEAWLQSMGWPFVLSLSMSALVAGITGILVGLPACASRACTWRSPPWPSASSSRRRWCAPSTSPAAMPAASSAKLVIAGIDFDDGTNFYYLVTGIAVLCVLGVLNLLRSPTGRAFVAIRDSEVSAQSMGINIAHYKTVAFALSAALAGIAGALYAHKIRIITPDQFGFLQSIELLMMVVIGGLGAIQGAIFGPAFWFIVQQVIVIGKDWLPPALGQQTGLQPTIFGIILIAVVLFEPMGLYGRWLKFRTFLQIFPFYRKGMFKRQKSYMKSERMK